MKIPAKIQVRATWNSQRCWELLANNIATVSTVLNSVNSLSLSLPLSPSLSLFPSLSLSLPLSLDEW